MPEAIKILLAIASVFVVAGIQRLINLKKDVRGRQILAVYVSPAIALLGVILAYALFDKISFEEQHQLYGAEILLWNLIIAGGYLLIKIVLLPIMKSVWAKNTRMEYFSSTWYEHDTDYDAWFLRLRYRNVRTLFNILAWVATTLSAIILAITWYGGKESSLWLVVFPISAAVVLTEISIFLSGYTKPEYLHSVGGEDITASKVSAFYKLRKIYEKMFPAAMLFSHTGNENGDKQGATELIKTLKDSNDPKEQIVGRYFSHHKKKDGLFDVDLISVTNKLLHRESAVVFNPFYRDLSDYVLLPIVDNLINNKKCLIVIGRGSLCDDVVSWASDILKGYSKTRNLWRVETLTEQEPDCEVGVLSFSQIYDAKVINANADFVRNTGFVLFIEPSKMMTTSQSGLGIIVEKIDKGNEPTYCICDHDVDGLVDTMSHILQTNLTNVVASPIPRSVYTAIGWSASGDFMRQKLFDKQTHYLGNGIEVAAVALKNQVPHVTWYSAEKAPVQDIKWIAGQYYSQICRYAHLPCQQKSIDDRISFSSNLWDATAKKEEFVIAEDEFCNLFASLRAYLTRGTEQSFVNVISENYLLRDYMRYNQQLFLTDPKAIPAIAPHYAKTERNTILRLILMMACAPVKEEYIAHELSMLGYKTDDVYTTLSKLIYHYTFVADTIITVQNRQEMDDDLIPVQVCCYSISKQVFDENFADTLKNAFFVVEDEKFNTEYIDARLFEHITQTVMPGQYVTYSGKHYKVHAVSPQVGCILHRAADGYRGRHYYRQLRKYVFDNDCELISTRRVMDIEIALERRAFNVSSTGYLELRDNHDLRSARYINLSADPNISVFNRSYKNKTVLRISLPDTDERMRFTISMLLSEIFKSTFPDAWPYLAVLCSRPEDIEGMLDKFNYAVDGQIDESMIYIVEDSDMDLGLIEAIDNNLMRFFEIMSDYLNWHFDKMREPPRKDPVLPEIEAPKEEDVKRKGFLSQIAKRFARLFGNAEGKKKDKKDKNKDQDNEPVKAEDGAQEEPAQTDVPVSDTVEFEDKDSPDTASEEVASTETVGQLSEEFEIAEEGQAVKEEAAGESAELPENKAPVQPPIEEQIILHSEGEDWFPADGVPDDLDLLMPIKPSRYQKECFLKFGFDEIDSRLSIEDVRSYLTVRGWSNNEITKARKRTAIEDTQLDLTAENHCDFCGLPLSGVSYDRLADGRTRCFDCSMTSINKVEDFKKLFIKTEVMLESTLNVQIPVNIAVRTTDAKTIAQHTGQVFTPSTKFAARVLGFAQRKNGRYSLFIENGSPRLAAIDTTAHELTHIWQYLNWKDSSVVSIYRQRHPALTKVARDIVYEGMAMWTAIQILYSMGETSYARQQELLAESRNDVYGLGFKLYRDRFSFDRTGDAPVHTPFASFPSLDPAEVKKVIEEAL